MRRVDHTSGRSMDWFPGHGPAMLRPSRSRNLCANAERRTEQDLHHTSQVRRKDDWSC